MKSSTKMLALALAVCVPLALCAAGCAPKQATQEDSGDDGQTADTTQVATEWSPEIDCSACHTAEAETAADSSCLAGFHTTSQGFECVTCHADEAALTDVHKDMSSGKTPKKLTQTEVSADLCLTCHDQAKLAEDTASSAVLTDSNGKVVNPHDMPVNDAHTKEGINCISCHKGHTTEGVETDAQELCISCHHAEVYECGTCHEER